MRKNKKKPEVPTVAAVVPAAGNATRMKGLDKLFLKLDDIPIIIHTLRVLNAHPQISEIILPTREDCIKPLWQLCQTFQISKVSQIIRGGKTRAESVLFGLREVRKDCKLVAIHDAARPFVTEKVISDAIEAAQKYSAAAPAVPIVDTVKEQSGGIVLKTLERDCLAAIQTPQVFDKELILSALSYTQQENIEITDDCSAVEAVGMRVVLTMGDPFNRKITTPEDLVIARAILEYRRNG